MIKFKIYIIYLFAFIPNIICQTVVTPSQSPFYLPPTTRRPSYYPYLSHSRSPITTVYPTMYPTKYPMTIYPTTIYPTTISPIFLYNNNANNSSIILYEPIIPNYILYIIIVISCLICIIVVLCIFKHFLIVNNNNELITNPNRIQPIIYPLSEYDNKNNSNKKTIIDIDLSSMNHMFHVEDSDIQCEKVSSNKIRLFINKEKNVPFTPITSINPINTKENSLHDNINNMEWLTDDYNKIYNSEKNNKNELLNELYYKKYYLNNKVNSSILDSFYNKEKNNSFLSKIFPSISRKRSNIYENSLKNKEDEKQISFDSNESYGIDIRETENTEHLQQQQQQLNYFIPPQTHQLLSIQNKSNHNSPVASNHNSPVISIIKKPYSPPPSPPPPPPRLRISPNSFDVSRVPINEVSLNFSGLQSSPDNNKPIMNYYKN